jgi:hypothetical protein
MFHAGKKLRSLSLLFGALGTIKFKLMIQKLLLIITAFFLLTNTAFAVYWKYLAEREDDF